MASTVKTEGAFFLTIFNDVKKYHATNPMKVSKTEAMQDLSRLSSGIDSYEPIDGQAIANHYLAHLPEHNHSLYLEKTGNLQDFMVITNYIRAYLVLCHIKSIT